MKRGELRQFLWSAPVPLTGKTFLVIDARQTLTDFLMDGKLCKNWNIFFIRSHSRSVDETG
jgi:hypothetical protein